MNTQSRLIYSYGQYTWCGLLHRTISELFRRGVGLKSGRRLTVVRSPYPSPPSKKGRNRERLGPGIGRLKSALEPSSNAAQGLQTCVPAEEVTPPLMGFRGWPDTKKNDTQRKSTPGLILNEMFRFKQTWAGTASPYCPLRSLLFVFPRKGTKFRRL